MYVSRLIPALALVLGLGGAASANDSYVRFESANAQDAALQCAVAHFKAPDRDVEVILYGVVHIADAEYYARVQQDLNSYSVVLFEGVAPGKEAPTEEDKGLGELQGAMGEMLGLTFQKDGIDYTQKNLVHADMNMDELKEAMGGGSINPLGQLLGEDQMKNMAPFLRMLANMGKAFMENNPAMRNQMKRQMASQLGKADMNQLQQGLGKEAAEAILYKRNAVVVEKLKQQLETTKSGTIAIFYGAAHMPDLENSLNELGFSRSSKRWMTAWQIGEGVADSEEAPAPAPTAKPKGPRWF